MKNFAKKLIIGTGVAALVGYLAGILTAPKSGQETREDIKKATRTGMSEAERQLKKLSTELADLIDESKQQGEALKGKAAKELGELTHKAKIAREKAREVVSALHEGDAEDEDLRVAVREANLALKHLRDYLQK